MNLSPRRHCIENPQQDDIGWCDVSIQAEFGNEWWHWRIFLTVTKQTFYFWKICPFCHRMGWYCYDGNSKGMALGVKNNLSRISSIRFATFVERKEYSVLVAISCLFGQRLEGIHTFEIKKKPFCQRNRNEQVEHNVSVQTSKIKNYF